MTAPASQRRPAGRVRAALDRTAALRRQRLRLLRLCATAPRPAAVLLLTHVWTAAVPAATALATGWLVARLAASATGDAPAGAAVWPLVVLAALLVSDEVFTALGRAVEQFVAGRVDTTVRGTVRRLAFAPPDMAHLEDPAFADDASRASDLGSGRVRSPGTAAVGQLRLVFRVVAALGSAVLVATFSVPLAVFLLAASLAMRALVRRQWIHLIEVRDARESLRRRGDYWTDVAAAAPAAKEVRLFGLADWVVRRRTEEVLTWAGVIWATRRQILRQQGWTAVLALTSSGAALLVPGLAAERGALSVSGLVTVLVAAWGVFGISTMGHEAFDIEYGLGAVQALDRLTSRAGPAPAPAGGRPARSGAPPELRLQQLAFGYPGTGRRVLDGVDLRVAPGEVLAVVGRNGAGKTTLITLLAGLYQPSSGRLLVDGAAVPPAALPGWRRRVAVIFQDFNRYPLSVADNIALAAPEHRDDLAGIRAAAVRAGAAEFVEALPEGYRTPLTREQAGGTELSGGQWQRIALARAVFATEHGRDLLILDEPTAHLDVAAEAGFYRQVVAEVAGCTVLLISHRLSTVRNADRIVLLDGGRVAEQGTHDSLLAADGEYARLFRLQAARFEDAVDAGLGAAR